MKAKERIAEFFTPVILLGGILIIIVMTMLEEKTRLRHFVIIAGFINIVAMIVLPVLYLAGVLYGQHTDGAAWAEFYLSHWYAFAPFMLCSLILCLNRKEYLLLP